MHYSFQSACEKCMYFKIMYVFVFYNKGDKQFSCDISPSSVSLYCVIRSVVKLFPFSDRTSGAVSSQLCTLLQS